MDVNKTQVSPNFKSAYILKGAYSDIKKFEKVLFNAFQTTADKTVLINGKAYSMPVTKLNDSRNFCFLNDTFVTDVKTKKDEVAKLFVTNDSVIPLIRYRNEKRPYANLKRSLAFDITQMFDDAAKKSNEALQNLIQSTKVKYTDIFNKIESSQIAIFDAKDALSAAQKNKFDFVNGIIK